MTKISAGLALALIVLLGAVPVFVAAQEDVLVGTIKAEILKDPRAGDISPAQLDAMVAALAQAAAEQGVTASDITWQPVSASVEPAATTQDACGFLCNINRIFGFNGDDFTIPIGLGITSALLILFISLMLHRHHVHGVHPTIEAVHELPEHPSQG